MNILVMKDQKAVGVCGAQMVAEEMKSRENVTISFPTGSSPIACFNELVRMHTHQGLDFSNVTGFSMDEYIPLAKSHPQSCYYFLEKYLYGHVNMDQNRIHYPDATDPDLKKVCQQYTQSILDMGGFDVIILGIGRDGHITFNMPGEVSQVYTYVESLSEQTVEDNARFFEEQEEIPSKAITLGMNLILNSKKIILLADGASKAEAIGQLVNRQEINSQLPASFLWLHNHVSIIVDEAAASQIETQNNVVRYEI